MTSRLSTLSPAARRPLGQSGLSVGPLAWGMWRFKGQDIHAAQARAEAALEAGMDLFDTADVYGLDNDEPFGAAESLLGKVLKASPALRDRMVLATKGGIEIGTPYNSSRSYVIAACEASLKRMGVERVELYQIHRPDPFTHPAELAEALDTLRRQGKIVEAGVSNHTPAQVAALQAHLSFPLASIQPEFSPLATEPLADGVLDQAVELGMTVLAWSPLGGGRIAADQSQDPRVKAVIEALDKVARAQGVSRTSVAYAWIMAHPSRPIPIVGTQEPARIRQSTEALKVELGRADIYAILTAARGAPLP
jgi:predicted oxidoreductase